MFCEISSSTLETEFDFFQNHTFQAFLVSKIYIFNSKIYSIVKSML